jgi:hypothetical protein
VTLLDSSHIVGDVGHEIIMESDDRGRVSLAKLPGDNAARYVGRRLADGSILLQPAVVLTSNALKSLVALQASDRPTPRVGRPLREALDDRLVPRSTEEDVERARLMVGERRSRGARLLTDLSANELDQLRGGAAN